MFYLSLYTVILWRLIDNYSINTPISYICMMILGVCIFQQLVFLVLIEIDDWKEDKK